MHLKKDTAAVEILSKRFMDRVCRHMEGGGGGKRE